MQPTPWPSSGLRRASVNSFGFGGSNVHVVLDDAYHYLTLRNLVGSHHTVEKANESEDLPVYYENRQSLSQMNGAAAYQTQSYTESSMPRLLVWSASDEGGLQRLKRLYSKHLAELPQAISKDDSTYFENLVYTICTKRSSLSWKSFVIADSTIDLRRRLENNLSRPTRSSHLPKLAFIFTGQGAQWCSMGKELLIYPLFQESLQKAEKFFQSLGCKWDILGRTKSHE